MLVSYNTFSAMASVFITCNAKTSNISIIDILKGNRYNDGMKTHENPYIIFSRECKFVAGAANVGAIPNTHLAEVAFVGRSNVGKSSLLNAIVNRNSLARISQNPGCTRQINFFNLADACHLVDLPGYGFARTSKVEKERWS